MPGLRGMPAVMTTISEFAGVFIVVGAGDVGVALFDGHGFEQIQSFALRDAFDDVNEDYVGQFFGSDPVAAVAPTFPEPTMVTFFRMRMSPFGIEQLAVGSWRLAISSQHSSPHFSRTPAAKTRIPRFARNDKRVGW